MWLTNSELRLAGGHQLVRRDSCRRMITKFTQIQPNTLPIFITYNVYLTERADAALAATIAPKAARLRPRRIRTSPTSASRECSRRNVSALSHEIGEWLDDPLVVNTGGNPVSCGILEVGDPEEGFANYGDFNYTLNGFTYTLQDLTYLEYFGAPTTTSVGGERTFHNNPFTWVSATTADSSSCFQKSPSRKGRAFYCLRSMLVFRRVVRPARGFGANEPQRKMSSCGKCKKLRKTNLKKLFTKSEQDWGLRAFEH